MASGKFDILFGFEDHEREFHRGSKPMVFANNPSDIKRCIVWCKQQIKEFAKKHPEIQIQVAVEATGVYHELFIEKAFAAGLNVCVVMPKVLVHYRLSKNIYTKNDKQDAILLANLGCERPLKSWAPGSPNLMEIRGILRHRTALVKMRTMLKNQTHAYSRCSIQSKALKECMRDHITTINKQIKKLENAAKKLRKSDQELDRRLKPIIKTVPGVGWLTALTVIAETNGFSEQSSAKQLASYAGLDIIENQSGKSTGKTRMSKRGNSYLRSCLYMSASNRRQKKSTGPIAEFGRRIALRNPTSTKKATVAIMRKQLLLIRTLWNSGEDYDPNYEVNKKEKQEANIDSLEQSSETISQNKKQLNVGDEKEGNFTTTSSEAQLKTESNAGQEVKKGSPDKDVPRLREVASQKELLRNTKIEKKCRKYLQVNTVATRLTYRNAKTVR